MGSIAQEMGHDLTIMYFIDNVLKSKDKEDFFIIHSAIGPKRDIHYWNPEHNEYTSGWDSSGDKRFIPDYLFRRRLSEEELKRLVEESQYQDEEWYRKLSQQLGEELKNFTDRICGNLEKIIQQVFPEVDKLPDFIGIKEGNINLIGEIKFEYLPKRALNEFLAYQSIAEQYEIPFYLVFPKKGYTRTDFNWLSKNLSEGVEFYPFQGAELKPIIVPNCRDIKFEKWLPK